MQGNGNHGILAHGRYEGSVIFFSLFSAIWSNEIKLIANVKNMRWDIMTGPNELSQFY